MPSSWLLTVVPVLLAFFVISRRSRKQLPPGPRPIPLLGNVLQMPTSQPWIKFSKWASVYGDVVHVDALGQPIVILSSRKAIQDLVGYRSSIYSSRPYMAMTELSTFDRIFPLQPYGDEWREQRKLAFSGLNKVVPTYYRLKEQEARRLIHSLLKNPDELFSQVKLRITSIIIRVNYGCYPASIDDPIAALPLKGFEGGKRVFEPWLVSIFPSLRHLPPWFPGTQFLQVAKSASDALNEGLWYAYRACKKNMEEGTALQPSLCETVLSSADGSISAEEEFRLVYGLGASLLGGLDTSMVVALVFLLFMVRHPEIQEKARQEIDSVIGPDRLPTLDDQDKLPYVRAIMTEAFRICPPLPTGLPHYCEKDDFYNGFFIPKGATIITNIYHILRDPEVFPNPDTFDPDRYNLLGTEMQKVTDVIFGTGRRRCPGVDFAEETAFAIIATVLSTCYIVPQVDDDGVKIIPKLKLVPGIVVFPEEFKCKLVCRSKTAMELLQVAETSLLV